MAILMTTNYQLISTINLMYADVKTYARFISQSKENNQTTYQIKSTYYIPTQNNVAFSRATATLDGDTKNYGYTTFYRGETLIQEYTRTITHNQDGSSPTKNVATSWNASFGGSGSTSADIYFPSIQRYPLITSATNFTDEGNPTITYTTISGFNNATYNACISLDGTTDDIPYRQVNLSDGTYTFELTNEERTTLRNAIPEDNSLNVVFILKTTNGNNNYFSTASGVMTIIDGNPTFTYSVEETNQKVINALGSSSADTIVQDVSELLFTITPTALKGATIEEVKIVNRVGNEFKNYYMTTSPYTTTIPVMGPFFQIIVTDSRGNKRQTGVPKEMISYKRVKINNFSFVRDNPTSSDIIVDLNSDYFETDDVTNIPIVKWKLDNGNFTAIPSTSYSIDTTNNKLTINDYTLTNALVYTNAGTFTIEISDIFTTDSNNIKVTKGIPTMSLGEHDLQINGDLFIADTSGNNSINVKELLVGIKGKILWTNNAPTSQFVGDINLSSSDYDFYEIVYQLSISNFAKVSTGIIPKGSGTQLIFIFNTNSAHIHISRQINYSSDVKLSADNCYESNSNNYNNGRCIPIYVIGYNRGLF